MALRKQTIDLPFGGGIDSKTHPHLVDGPKLSQLINGRFNKSGAIEPRREHTLDDATSLVGYERLVEYDGTLLGYTKEGLYQRADNDSQAHYELGLYKGPRAVDVQVRDVVRTDEGAAGIYCAANNGYAIYVWSAGIGGEGQFDDAEVWYRIVDVATGADIQNPKTLDPNLIAWYTSTPSRNILESGLHVTAIDDTKFVVVCSDLNSDLWYQVIDTVNGTVTEGTAAKLQSIIPQDIPASGTYVHSMADGQEFFICQPSFLHRFTISGTVLTAESRVAIPAGVGTPRCVYHNGLGSRVVVFGENAGALTYAAAPDGTSLPGTLTDTGTTYTPSASEPDPASVVCVTRNDSGLLLVAFEDWDHGGGADTPPYQVKWLECGVNGAGLTTSGRLIQNMRLHGWPYRDSDDNILLQLWAPGSKITTGLPNGRAVSRTFRQLYQIDSASDANGRPVANYAIDIARRMFQDSQTYTVDGHRHTHAYATGGKLVTCSLVDDLVDQRDATATNPDNIWMGLGYEVLLGGHVGVADANFCALSTHGMLAQYDGDSFADVTIPPPMIREAVEVANTAGDYTGGRIAVRFVWRWRDGRGNVHRSAPSEPHEFDAGGATTFNTLEVKVFRPPPVWQGLGDGEEYSRLYLECYVSPDVSLPVGSGGPTLVDDVYVRHPLSNSFTNPPASRSDQAWAYAWEEIADPSAPWSSIALLTGVDLNSGDIQLYTNGGVLENDPTPCPAAIAASRDRIWIVDSDDRRRAWYSKAITPYVAPSFNAALTERLPANAGEITALGVVGDLVVLFTERETYALEAIGGPDDKGSGDWPPIRRISSEVGCTNRASVVTADVGLFFQGRGGIYLLTPAGQMVHVGRDLGLTSPLLQIIQANVRPRLKQVVFDAATGAVVYDYEAGQWSAYLYEDTLTITSTAEVDGVYYLGLDNGQAWREDQTSNTDVSLSLTTGWIKLAGLQGFKRIWRLGILGRLIYAGSPAGLDMGDLVVTVSYNYDASDSVTYTLPIEEISPIDPMHIRLFLARQKCTAIKVGISQTTPQGEENTLHPRIELTGLALEVGVKRGIRKIAHGGGGNVNT